VALTALPLLAARLRKEYSCTSTPPSSFHGLLQGAIYPFLPKQGEVYLLRLLQSVFYSENYQNQVTDCKICGHFSLLGCEAV